MRIHVIGSGPSGVHFAQTALERGYEVTLLDVGQSPEAPVLPEANWTDLKEQLDDPARYFLGDGSQGVVFPERDDEVYGFPPGRSYIFDRPPGIQLETEGFEPLLGFSRGGLAEAWTAGAYPFSREELVDFPFDAKDLFDAYGRVAERIGVTGDPDDDLAQFYPHHTHLMGPPALDAHSAGLVARYERRKRRLHRRGVYLGRTRIATLSEPLGQRPACSRCGRCLWGCPTGSLYTPSMTLADLQGRSGFRYVPGVRVLSIEANADGRATGVQMQRLSDGTIETEPVDRIALAAGALSTSEIVLRSWVRLGHEPTALEGLMDNRQVLVPFLNLGRVGQPYETARYQYHVLGLGLRAATPKHYVHCQVTTLGPALMHPVVQKLPVSLRSAARIGALLHGALGLVNVNYHDDRRATNRIALRDGDATHGGVVRLEYAAPADEQARIEETLARLKGALRTLGCIVPPGMVHTRPMGASVHYAGTLPMTLEDRPLTTTPAGRLRPFANVWVADGASFPFLPAKNLTFTLMANATRIAHGVDA